MKKIIMFVCSFCFCAFLDAVLVNPVNRVDFFEKAMGVKEEDFARQVEKYFLFAGDSKDNAITRIVGEFTIFHVGDFEQASIGELRKKTEDLFKSSDLKQYGNVGGGTFNVIEAIKPSDKDGTSKYVDIGAMQADQNYRYATFQVASNFNALELRSKNDDMSDISKYIDDKTQGPFASISAPYGLIYRHYYMFADKTTDAVGWKQIPKRQINFLDATDIPVTNSYVDFATKAPNSVKNAKIENIKVGVHKNLNVLFGYMPDFSKFEMLSENDSTHQIIHQVFTAAVDFGSTNGSFANNADAQIIAQTILDAAYEGTLRAAFMAWQTHLIERKKTGMQGGALPNNKVVLTLVGGGVFKNDFASIASAIEKNKDFIEKSGLQVELVIYDSASPSIDPNMMNQFKARMETLVKETGGFYKQYSAQYPKGKDIVAPKKKTTVSTGGPVVSTSSTLADALAKLTTALQNLATALK